MENSQIRFLLKMKGIPFWKVAKAIGISEATMTKWMRTPLSEDHYDKILNAVDQIERGEDHE